MAEMKLKTSCEKQLGR